ncbi:MAG: hypothetical protein RLZZ511_282 [Cyanobacteriota bacterium]
MSSQCCCARLVVDMSGNLVASPRLKPQLGTGATIVLGLGSILGTGVFVSLAIATAIAGTQIFLALSLAAGLALCNALSAAQLAAAHPVNGGTYAYGYRYLHPYAGFVAGWVFLLAKSASAATAALGLAAYFGGWWGYALPLPVVPTALVAVVVMTVIAALGVRKSNWVNAAIVGWTLLGLGCFVVAGLGQSVAPVDLTAAARLTAVGLTPTGLPVGWNWGRLFQATALMFVAYAGYARITTMTEEVRRPRRSIPIAMVVCLSLTLALYMLVAGTLIDHWGTAQSLFSNTALPPLSILVQQFQTPWPLVEIVESSAIVALLGVLLNLVLGLSRVLLAMGRQGDMPLQLAALNRSRTTPTLAIWITGGLIALLVTIGNVKTTWSFSAFNVLIYYTLTNLAALRLSVSERRYPRWVSVIGLVGCLSLAFWVDRSVWQWGLLLILLGCLWKAGRDFWARSAGGQRG